jgi:trigger factor
MGVRVPPLAPDVACVTQERLLYGDRRSVRFSFLCCASEAITAENIMKIDFDELSPVQRKVHIELPPDKVASEFSRAYQDLGRRVRIKGFRVGKAPRSVLKGIYGDEIRGQVRSQLVEHSLGEVIKERGLQIVSRPEIDAAEPQEGREFSFSAVFEVKPEIDVNDYVGIEVEKVRVAVTDDQVYEALKRLQQSHAHLEPVTDRELVERGDFVAVDFVGSVDGKPLSDGKRENYLVEVGAGQALPQFENALQGAKIGEEKNIKVTYPETYSNRDLAGKTAEFSLLVREIKQKVLPSIDDEFAKDHGESSSLEELRNVIRHRLEAELKQYQREELKEKILNHLIEGHSFTPPTSMVERQTRYLMQRNTSSSSNSHETDAAPTTEETRKAIQGRAFRQVQATLLIEKISRLEKINVEDRDVQERIDQMARAAGERGKALRDVYSKSEARDDLRSQLVFERTLDFLLERANVKEVDSPLNKVDDQNKKS